MHAWLFRNRARLRIVLGLAAPPEAPQADAIPAGRAGVRRMVARRKRKRLPRPGQVTRSGALVVLLPMPRRRT